MADQAPDQNLADFLGVKPAPAWQRWAKWALIAVGVVLLLLLANRLIFGAAKTDQYATAAVTRGDLTVSVSATGKLAPTNQVTVGSQLSGLVTRVVVDVNDHVTAGQPLALIDPQQIDDQIRQQQAQIAAAQAQVGQASATLAQAAAQRSRLEEVYRLSNGRVPSRTELETGRADYARAAATLKAQQASVVAAQAQLAQSQTQRARAVIRSPVAGVVLARQIDPGATVAASFNTPTLFVIAEDLTRMKLEVAIDEADVGAVQNGQRASFTVDAFPGKTFPAQISRVDLGSNLTVSAASSTTTTSSTGQVVSYAADLTVANPSGQLRPGMTATADIVTSDRHDVLLVPNAALRFKPAVAGAGGGVASSLTFGPRRGATQRTATVGRGGHQTVFIKGADGQPQAVQVTTGDTNGSVTEILGGTLQPGAQVITGVLAGGETAGGARSGASGGQRRQGGGQ